MLKALEWQAKTEQWADPSLIPHPTTWLNGARWEDDRAAFKVKKVADKTPDPIPQQNTGWCYACEKTRIGDRCKICGLTEAESIEAAENGELPERVAI